MEWIQSNWEVLTIASFLLLRLAESIAMATETDADDKVVARIKKSVQHFFTFGWKSE